MSSVVFSSVDFFRKRKLTLGMIDGSEEEMGTVGRLQWALKKLVHNYAQQIRKFSSNIYQTKNYRPRFHE